MFNYPLGLNSTKTTPEVKTELLGLLGLRHLSEAPVRWPALWGISVYDGESRDEATKKMYTKEFGAPATTAVNYALNYKVDEGDIEQAEFTMLVSAAQLAERMDASAVLFFETGPVVMRRVDGVLYLSEKWRVLRGTDVVSRLPGEPVFRDDLGIL
ncbi:MAG: hypothetical protein LBK42_03360 [Propionibacteriaceae bacterium]|jgi:hypothetical protein|nr:hypothetical protein [Propionibacteriaceae bacterium]